tara:strand:+ start:381 stop:1397 length:1017 start_codon:yes stop_codon:yes gene_type:complete
MSFFDKKFDVLDIQLTPYGRHLLQNGKLMPMYYAFFDDDVIYDSQAAGFTEKNSDVKNRILNETPVLRAHYLFKNLEDSMGKDQPFPTTQHDKVKRPGADERSKFLQYSLGTSDPTKEKAPAWQIFALQNEFSASTNQLSSSTFQNVNIPQLDFDIDYEISIENINDQPSSRGMMSTPDQQVGEAMADGTYVKVEQEQVLLHILEKNGFLYGDALELEVFMYEVTGSATGEQSFTGELIPLKFQQRKQAIVNDILIDDPEEDNIFERPQPKDFHKYVEYYFDCRLDKEIPLKDLCEGIGRLKATGSPVDFDIECPDDAANLDGVSIYSSNVTDREDCD